MGVAFDAEVQLRAHGQVVGASVVRTGDEVRVRLAEPMRGIAPGQSLVVYDGTRVLGQATISAAGRAAQQDGDRAAVSGAAAG